MILRQFDRISEVVRTQGRKEFREGVRRNYWQGLQGEGQKFQRAGSRLIG